MAETDTASLREYFYVTQKSRAAPFEKKRITAANMEEAEAELLNNRVPVLAIWRRTTKKSTIALPSKMSGKAKILFFQQIRSSQGGGIPISQTLDIVIKTTLNKKGRKAITRMKEDVEAGSSLALAMKSSGMFTALEIGIINSGEQTATLGEACSQIVDMLNRSIGLGKKIRTIMTYPTIVVISAIICIYVLVGQVVPQIVPFFTERGHELPLPTLLMVQTSHFISSHFIISILIVGSMITLVLRAGAIYRAWPACHIWILKTPVIGPLMLLLIQETFSRTFVTLSKSGVPTTKAFDLLRDVSDNYAYKAAIARCKVGLANGTPVGVTIRDEVFIFGQVLVSTIAFGEEVARTNEVLKAISDQLSLDVSTAIDQFKEAITPLITWVLGLIVFAVLSAAFLPMFTLPSIL